MDDFDREVYCIAGLPFDAVNMASTMKRLRDAKFKKTPCFLTTPNLNFLAMAREDADFRSSVIQSDIVIADGTPIVWMAKMLGLPVRERVAGSTLFEVLGREWRRKMSVYFFGGPDGVAAEASKHINEKSTGLRCVGYYSPGFGGVTQMSDAAIINGINATSADFLVVALGAKKGQAWIMRNLHLIKLPLVSHLGAVINFEAKRLKRAPARIQKIGLEWAWRIKEEPHLWRRYWHDGLFFLRLLTEQVLPYALWRKLNLPSYASRNEQGQLLLEEEDSICRLRVKGAVMDPVAPGIRDLLRQASQQGADVMVDLGEAEFLGPGFFGQLLMLKKQLNKQSLRLDFTGIGSKIKRHFHWNGLEYLINQSPKEDGSPLWALSESRRGM